MRDLLQKNELRRLEMTEILFKKHQWMPISELAEQLGSSIRIIKYDLDYFKKSTTDFIIETSTEGIKLIMNNNKSIKTVYKHALINSTSFNLLEFLLLDESKSVHEIAEQLSMSDTTLYRLVNTINKVAIKYGFQIATNPCRIVGNEANIRSFYNRYFFEKYTQFDWPYESIGWVKTNAIDRLLQMFVNLTDLPVDFAYYGMLKLSSFVNLMRYNNKHFISQQKNSVNFLETFSEKEGCHEAKMYYEDTFERKLDMRFLNEVFTPFLTDGFSLNYESLLNKVNANEAIAKEFNFLENLLDELVRNNEIPLSNKEAVLLDLLNASYIGTHDPRSRYILYNQNHYFVETIAEYFPDFHQQLYKGFEGFLQIRKLPVTDEAIDYLIYILFTRWNHIVPILREKFRKIKILVISNKHYSHSRMIKEFIEYEFNKQLKIDIYSGLNISTAQLEDLEHDFIIANFELPDLSSKNCLCIENIPTFKDIIKIQREIENVISSRRLNERAANM